ncbi:hypothetical protein CA600_12520 [Paenibacillus sp. VTT E-133280]|uniref:hypothetical protein n=1 Tax=Paenibacillus sp. VTT E-133280 TaxID=1986222 RepID=UPI000BA0B4B4|nr:hypothetical protein [Paenibacillus sp. VTT E-133280]OZQ66077.1 hypothetical protein CA600_12520 [Paenibacillus sp. VTT E-133280]
MKLDPALKVLSGWLKKQEQIFAIPTGNDKIIIINGKDITEVMRGANDTILAVTPNGNFRLLNEVYVAALLMPKELEKADMQRISNKLHINLRRVQEIDRKKRNVTVEGRIHKIEKAYWEKFIEAYDNQ